MKTEIKVCTQSLKGIFTMFQKKNQVFIDFESSPKRNSAKRDQILVSRHKLNDEYILSVYEGGEEIFNGTFEKLVEQLKK